MQNFKTDHRIKLFVSIFFIFVLIVAIIGIVVAVEMSKRENFDAVADENIGSYFKNTDAYVICTSDEIYKTAKERIQPTLISTKDPNISVDLQKFDAVKGSELGNLIYDRSVLSLGALYDVKIATNRRTHAELGTLNAIGCSMSHFTLWRKLLDSTSDGYFIFESDALCNKSILGIVKKFLESEKNPVHILFLGTFGPAKQSIGTVTRLTSRTFGTHSYYITRTGAEICLKYAFPIEQQIDSYLSDLNILSQNKVEVPEIFFYSIQLCMQYNPTGSTIQLKKIVCDV